MTHLNDSYSASDVSETSYTLTAVIASCGDSFEVEVNPTITGIELKQKIAEDTSISMDDQVLFTQHGIKLKKLSLSLSHSTYNNDIFISNNDESYTLSMAPHIYIFDKHHGERPSIPTEYVLNPKNYIFNEQKLNNASRSELLPSSEQQLNEDDIKNKTQLLNILNVYKTEYDSSYKLIKVIKEECLRKMTASKKYVKQIQFQYKSLKVLLKHFNQLKGKLSKQQNKFISKCDEQIVLHEQYLNEFETDLNNLQLVELHSSLQNKSRKTMLDVVDEGSFRKWFQKASTAQDKQQTLKIERVKNKEHIADKLKNIKQSIDDIKKKKINFGTIRRELHENEALYLDIDNMGKMYAIKHKKIQNTLSILTDDVDDDISNISLDFMMELNNVEQFDADRDKLHATNASFFKMLEHIASIQEAMVNEFTLNVADITSLNGLISSESRTMDAFAIALDRKDALFFEFVKLKALPSAYNHCLDEIKRRRAFGILMQNEVNHHLNDIFVIFRRKEIEKRRAFINEYGMLPVDLVSGLTLMPGGISISYSAANEEILPIVEEDIDMIKDDLCSEFEDIIGKSESKWCWKYKSKVMKARKDNNKKFEILKEQNKWKTERLHLIKDYEDKMNKLNEIVKNLELRNEDLHIELETYKAELPDAPSFDDDMNGMEVSEYLANRLSTILGASIPSVNASALEQSRMFLSTFSMKSNNDAAIATNKVLQSDLDNIKSEMLYKDNEIKKLKMEKDKLKQHNDQYILKLDKLSESSSNLRNEMESMLVKHRKELEMIEMEQNEESMKLKQEMSDYKTENDKLSNGRIDLLQQIKMLSDVSEEWEEKFNSLSDEYLVYKTETEQKDNDPWSTMSLLTNRNLTELKHNCIWLNGEFEINAIAGNNLLFVRDKQANAYRALLDYKGNKNVKEILVDEDLIKSTLQQLNYPHLLIGEVIYIVERTIPKDIGQFKKGDRVLIATAGSLRPVNFNLPL